MKVTLAMNAWANVVASAGGKTAVFGLLKRNGRVFVVVVQNTKTNSLMPIIASKIKPDSVVCTDSYRSYNALGVSDFNI